MNTWLAGLKVFWAVLSGLAMPVILTVVPVMTGSVPFFVAAGCFSLAGCIPFIKQLSIIARFCLILAVVGAGLIHGDPHRWPDGLLLTLGVPLILYFMLRGASKWLKELGTAMRSSQEKTMGRG
ncbi:hypothetical protein ACSVIJ_01950 [Pseudomonas sp. NCHU5208]|uniref:hypothetical protein n=1 Tax=unclassified Pseudomonas TaxID=196821 RepID=UPI003F9A6666